MCVEIASNNLNAVMEISAGKSNKKMTYSLKKLIKQLFKQHKSEKLIIIQNQANAKKAASLESLESMENSRNADIEAECMSLESYENDANERLSTKLSSELEDYDFAELDTVPVHFVRTAHGTFFWTATAELPADNDLIEPLYCCTSNQIASSQFGERWAQA